MLNEIGIQHVVITIVSVVNTLEKQTIQLTSGFWQRKKVVSFRFSVWGRVSPSGMLEKRNR